MNFSFLKERRWQMVLVLMVTFFVGFLDRLNITFALPLMAAEYNWSQAETQRYGSMLMGFFYGAYGLANMLLSPLAGRFGPRKSLMTIVVLWSIFTAMGAWVSQFMMLLLASRVLLGLSEGVHVPMMTTATKIWFPQEERARANSIIVSGIFLAVLLAPILMVPMMATYGWRTGFLLMAAAGLVISLPLVRRFVYDTPEQHPDISAKEVEHCRAGRDREAAQQEDISWSELSREPRFLLFLLIGVFNNLLSLGMTSWLPTYFTSKRGIPFEEITLLVTLPYAFSILGVAIWGFLGDRFNIRALIAGLGFGMSGLVIYVALGARDIPFLVVCFSLAVFLFSSFTAAEFALVQRILPMDKFTGGMGFYNGATALVGGGLGPLVMSPIIGDGDGTWIISVVALLNAGLLIWFYKMVRY